MDKLSICNSALMRCGAEPILIGELTTPTSKRGLAVVNQYETTLKEMLNDSSWNFATVRVELTEELTVPLFGATRLYTLPNDCIRVLELEDKVPYRVETGLIHCDQEGTIKIKYVFDNQDATTYSGAFVKAFYLKLAEDISYLMVQSSALQQAITAEAERYLRKARSMNSQEGTPESRYPEEYTAGIRR
jgi:hypothetical protein